MVRFAMGFSVGAVARGPTTLTVTSPVAVAAPSFAASRRTYVPALSMYTRVAAAAGATNDTAPGPDTLLHASVTLAGGAGNPSSVTVAARSADANGRGP